MSYESALTAAGAEVLDSEHFGSYQGEWWAKVRIDGHEYWINGAFGSCPYCDAFDGEFGDNSDCCETHRYASQTIKNACTDCAEKAVDYQRRLAAFGKDYLDERLTQEQAEAHAMRNIDWDSDAEAMIAYIKGNPLSQPQ